MHPAIAPGAAPSAPPTPPAERHQLARIASRAPSPAGKKFAQFPRNRPCAARNARLGRQPFKSVCTASRRSSRSRIQCCPDRSGYVIRIARIFKTRLFLALSFRRRGSMPRMRRQFAGRLRASAAGRCTACMRSMANVSRRRVLTAEKTVIRFRPTDGLPQKRVSQHTAKTRSKKTTSAPDFYKVDQGTVSAAKTTPPISRHLRRTRQQVFSCYRDRVPPTALSLPNPFRRVWRAGGCARVRYPRAA